MNGVSGNTGNVSGVSLGNTYGVGSDGVINTSSMLSSSNSSLSQIPVGDDSPGFEIQPASNKKNKNRVEPSQLNLETETEALNDSMNTRSQRIDSLEIHKENYASSTKIRLDSLMAQWEYLSGKQDSGAEVLKMEAQTIEQDRNQYLQAKDNESQSIRQGMSMDQELIEMSQENAERRSRGKQAMSCLNITQ